MGVAGFAGGDDHHAVVGFVFEVKKPQQGDGQFGTVGPRIELSAMSAWLGKSCPCACQGSLACDLDRVAVYLDEQGGAPPTVIGPLERRHLHDLQGVAGPGGD